METRKQNFDQLSTADAIAALEQTDAQRGALPYHADVTASDAAAFMRSHPSILVDVRTDAEWNYVGIPNLETFRASFIPLSWMLYPDYAKNQQFEAQLIGLIADKSTPVFFLCKVGGRSAKAAEAATSLGYEHCYNIVAGFEGEPNERSQRGTVNGWKAEGLPWKQS